MRSPTDKLRRMNQINRTLEFDVDTNARLREMAAERGHEVAAALAEVVALLDSVVDLTTWVASWRSADELPRPRPRLTGA
jgi:hypothetical protein